MTRFHFFKNAQIEGKYFISFQIKESFKEETQKIRGDDPENNFLQNFAVKLFFNQIK
jgi:hypothetical protein